MSQAQNKRTIERYVEEFVNKGNYSIKGELFAPGFVDHTPVLGLPGNADGLEQSIRALRTGFPDQLLTIDEIVLIGEEAAVVRFTIEGTHKGAFGNIPATGRHVKYSGLTFGRYTASGLVSELWTYRDDIGYLEQLGLLPVVAQAGAKELPAQPTI